MSHPVDPRPPRIAAVEAAMQAGQEQQRADAALAGALMDAFAAELLDMDALLKRFQAGEKPHHRDLLALQRLHHWAQLRDAQRAKAEGGA